MNVKNKLMWGIGTLLCLIVLLSGVGVRYVKSLKKDTNNILTANYHSLEYCRNMLLALDEISEAPGAVLRFEENLDKQLQNITEKEEGAVTTDIVKGFESLKIDRRNDSLRSRIGIDIITLMGRNMEAIQSKSKVADETAENAVVWIAVTGMLCFGIALFLLIRLPRNIAEPIRELTESIEQIANRNYSLRVSFKGHDEYGNLAKSFNAMAEKMEEYSNSGLEKILKEKKRMETLINNMHDPIVGLDENKTILFVNNEALKIFGLEKSEMLNRPSADVAVSNDLMRTLLVNIAGPSDKKSNIPLKIYFDEKESYFEKEIIRIEIATKGRESSELIGYVILLKNITPFKELDSARSNFIATISHELKTPISSIKLSTQLLEHSETGDLNEEQKQLVESIKEDSSRLLKITGELLNMTQAETGNIQLNIQSADPCVILQYAIDATKMQAEQRQVILRTDIEPGMPSINADAEKTAWVLTNFLTNAVRYSPECGEVVISLKKHPEGLMFSVKDSGKGIDERYKKKIFLRYFRIPGSSKSSGTGLGLAISKEFIEAQGGSIGVDTDRGLGSTFYFILPASKGDVS